MKSITFKIRQPNMMTNYTTYRRAASKTIHNYIHSFPAKSIQHAILGTLNAVGILDETHATQRYNQVQTKTQTRSEEAIIKSIAAHFNLAVHLFLNGTCTTYNSSGETDVAIKIEDIAGERQVHRLMTTQEHSEAMEDAQLTQADLVATFTRPLTKQEPNDRGNTKAEAVKPSITAKDAEMELTAATPNLKTAMAHIKVLENFLKTNPDKHKETLALNVISDFATRYLTPRKGLARLFTRERADKKAIRKELRLWIYQLQANSVGSGPKATTERLILNKIPKDLHPKKPSSKQVFFSPVNELKYPPLSRPFQEK